MPLDKISATPIAIVISLAAEGLDAIVSIIFFPLGALIASVATWIGWWGIYALGEFVEDLHAIRDKEGTTKEVAAKHEAEMKAKYEAEKKAKREAEEQSKREIEETIDNFVPNPSKTVIPNKYEDSYSCPKCGCTLKFGQKECLCSWQMDWSKYN